MCPSWKCPAHRVPAVGSHVRTGMEHVLGGGAIRKCVCTHGVQPISRELGRAGLYLLLPKGQVSSDASRVRGQRQLTGAAEVRRWGSESRVGLAFVGLGLGKRRSPGQGGRRHSQGRPVANHGRWGTGRDRGERRSGRGSWASRQEVGVGPRV